MHVAARATPATGDGRRAWGGRDGSRGCGFPQRWPSDGDGSTICTARPFRARAAPQRQSHPAGRLAGTQRGRGRAPRRRARGGCGRPPPSDAALRPPPLHRCFIPPRTSLTCPPCPAPAAVVPTRPRAGRLGGGGTPHHARAPSALCPAAPPSPPRSAMGGRSADVAFRNSGAGQATVAMATSLSGERGWCFSRGGGGKHREGGVREGEGIRPQGRPSEGRRHRQRRRRHAGAADQHVAGRRRRRG